LNELKDFDPRKQAWLNSFLDENHLSYTTSPDLVASPAQIRFMVYLEHDEPFYPCSEQLFQEIMARVKSPILGEQYAEIWARISRLAASKVEPEARRHFIIDLLNIKHQHETANYNVIPSRVEKRLFKLFMVTTQIEDPLLDEKTRRNDRAAQIYRSEAFAKAVDHAPPDCDQTGLEALRRRLDALKLRRVFQASVQRELWENDHPAPDETEWDAIFNRTVTGGGWGPLENFLLEPHRELEGHYVPRTILYLIDRAGEVVFDLGAIRMLIRLGHTVVLAVKNAAFHDYVYLGDMMNSPVLRGMCEDAEIITNYRLTKNQLASYLRNDKRFKIITDGTMEKFNLARTSVSFARVFKEVDGIISKGTDQRGRIFNSRFEFTQDVFNLALGPDEELSVMFKPVCSKVVRFSTGDLQERAQAIIDRMRAAKEKGWTVMFYSGVVGSIPGETDTAIEVMTALVKDLEEQQAETFIINPSTYFEKGMDADDLMYMWEIVQRSGYIDIWRFQSVSDVERSFALLGRKVPPQWVGKDATYSTGCTKEMAIALDVQRKNPEMQIIGPDPEKFVRRSEYGIGLFHDTKLAEIYEH
jgi:uncharacterized protein with ATP-grasp and redox domains